MVNLICFKCRFDSSANQSREKSSLCEFTMKQTLLLWVLFHFLQPAKLFSITCHIQTNYWTPFGSLEECFLTNINITASRETIDLVSNHFTNMNNIKSFHISMSPLCLYVPYGIEAMMPNIEALAITHSGLKFLVKDDLKLLNHLKGIYLNNNNLEVLEIDLFQHNTELQEINLSDNKIQNIAEGVFDSIPRLTKLELLRNVCVDKSALSIIELNAIKKELQDTCSSKVVEQTPKAEISFASFETFMNKVVELESKLLNLQSQFKDAMENICDICRLKKV